MYYVPLLTIVNTRQPTMRGIYVLHCLKPNRYYIHKVGQADNLGRRKGEYASHTFEPVFSRIYEIHDGFDLLKVEEALHNKLERLGVKVGPEWFEIEVDRIDQCALDLFLNEPGPFNGAMKDFHQTDPTEIERIDYGSTSKASSSNKNNTETATEVEVVETIYNPIPSGFTPREDQYELLAKLREHFIEQGHARGQIRLPPGYGKTQIGCSLFPIENGMKRILILVPSIKLAQETAMRVQTFHEDNLGITCFKYYQVHSDGTPYTLEEINSSEYVCIVGVYNSVAKLQGAKPFDIIIFDEAHRTSIKSRGNDTESDEDTLIVLETHFTFALSDANIQSKYRLFMTATPRIINNDDNSMSNTDKYGEVIFSMTIRQAVYKRIINDFKMWMYVTSHGEELSIDNDGERFALLLKFLEQCNGRKTLIVCRSIASCEFVTDRLKSTGLLNVYSVHSRMNKKYGEKQVEAFRKTPSKTALCAVNMFKEGIDCPDIDSVVFYDERSSVIDVLQIVGRGLRYKPDVDYTDIGILCSVNPSQRLDEQSEMRYLRMIIQNMFDHSEEVTSYLQIIKDDDSSSKVIRRVIEEEQTKMKDNEDTDNYENIMRINSNVKDYGELHFQQARAYAQERSALFNWRDESQWFDYVENMGKDLPRDIPRRPDRVYKKMGWISWDDFLGLDEEKAFDLSTYKYVLQNNLKNNNPTSEEYNEVISRYGHKRLVSPSECTRVYGKGFYDILESIFGPTHFTPLQELRMLKATFARRGVFTMKEYKALTEFYQGEYPKFPLVYYNITSLSRL